MGSSFTPKSHSLTAADVARRIEGFLEGRDGPQVWSEFCTFRITDPELDAIRKHCARLPEEFPAAVPGRYCGAGGYTVLRGYVKKLRGTGKGPVTAAPAEPVAASALPPKVATKVTGPASDRSISVSEVVEREEVSPQDGIAGTIYQAVEGRPVGYPADLPFIPNVEVRVTDNGSASRVQQWRVETVEATREAVLRFCLEDGWERARQHAVPEMAQKLMGLVLLRRGERWRYVTSTVLKAGSFVKLVEVPAGTPWQKALETR